MAARSVTILGSTGSVGVSTLDLLKRSGAEIDLWAITAGSKVADLAEQALEWRPRRAIIQHERLLPELRDRLAGTGIDCAAGEAAIIEAAGAGADWVMSAIVGAAGLAPTLAAARAGSTIALANKESLVCAGPALLAIARASGGRVIPVDSEHSAIFQVFETENAGQVSRVILTASGGPFRTWSFEAMRSATPAQAVAHPNWDMGPKISVDSATMMNKGLESIEAAYLFDMRPDQIGVVVHPQSVIHSLVEYRDGSTLAQLGAPDMRTPIAYAWGWPDRLNWPAPALDLAAVGTLTFEPPDEGRFPALRLAREALAAGGGGPAAMNAANEVAVAAFLNGEIGFLDIASVVDATLQAMNSGREAAPTTDHDAVVWAREVDTNGRRVAAQVLSRFGRMARV
jgi:1-deoxy-D-xylulose-5-phosphate reductoisomerase